MRLQDEPAFPVARWIRSSYDSGVKYLNRDNLRLAIEIGGLTAVFFTLQQTGESVRLTKEALLLSQDMKRTEARPYVSYTGLEVLHANNHIAFDLTLKNFTQPIALDVIVELYVAYMKVGESFPTVIGGDADHGARVNWILPSTADAAKEMNEMRDAIASRKLIQIHVKYRDVYGNLYETNGSAFLKSDGQAILNVRDSRPLEK